MTITTFEEHDEATAQLQSEPSSPVIGQQEELTGSIDLFHEMKLEMRATKGAALPSSLHDRLKSGITANVGTNPASTLLLHSPLTNAEQLSGNNNSRNSDITSRSQSSTLTTRLPGQSGTSRYQPLLQSNRSGSALTERLSNRPYEKDASNNLNAGSTRSVSIDTADTASTLPARTRLRRQRRMGSQDSSEQSEDPMERLNKLRARISGALSEVKGVLNKYSTETEPNDEVIQTSQERKSTTQAEQNSGPIQFRFVRKVRRRSVFNENDDNDESKSKEVNNTAPAAEAVAQKEKGSAIRTDEDQSDKNAYHMIVEVSESLPKVIESKIEISTPDKSLSKLEETQDKVCLDKKTTKNMPTSNLNVVIKQEKRRVSIGTVNDIEPQLIQLDAKIQRRPSDSVAIVKKFSKTTIKPEIIKDRITKKPQNAEKSDTKTSVEKIESLQKDPTKASTTPKSNTSLKDTTEDTVTVACAVKNTTAVEKQPVPAMKTGKRLSVKKSDSFRRSSIAAVERSKIEPPVLDVKIQRRPSDSEAILKKSTLKSITTTATRIKDATSLSRSSATPKDKINSGIKSKRSQAESIVDKSPNVEKNTETLKRDSENSGKDDGVTASAAALQQSVMMPIHSINVIDNDETSIQLSVPVGASALSPSLATVIGGATTATATATQKTEISVATNDLKSPRISDGQRTANVAVPLSLSQVNEASSQQANLDQIPSINVVSLEEIISPSTDNIANKQHIDPKRGQKAITSAAVQSVKPIETAAVNSTINHIAKTNESGRPETSAASKGDDIKKPIHQKEIIPVTITTSPSTQIQQTPISQPSVPSAPAPTPSSTSTSSSTSSAILPQPSVQELSQQASPQQVAVSTELVVIVPGDDICAHDRVPEIAETTAKKSLSEVNVAASSKIAAIPKSSSTGDDDATKASATAVTPDSGLENITTATSSSGKTATSSTTPGAVKESRKFVPDSEEKTQTNMPELQVLPGPVKALELHADSEVSVPFGESKEVFPKKKIIVKKLIRKGATEKSLISKKLTDNEEAEAEAVANEISLENNVIVANETVETNETSETLNESAESAESPVNAVSQPTTPITKPRKVKKKVIIKRLQRRLSGSEQTFFLGSNDEKPPSDVETLEKVIAYVTDDENDDAENNESECPNKSLKSCMRLREYQLGDWVMYAERYKKTQIRWKKGRIMERITSISYKVDIDGKEVSAHINYLKKYTGRKVRFGGKEYLEIDYEQIAEEEEKARTYSIWNLV